LGSAAGRARIHRDHAGYHRGNEDDDLPSSTGERHDSRADPVRQRAAEAVAAGQAVGWFFVRYSDPEPHLRIHFRGEPRQLTTELLSAVTSWAGELMASDRCHRLAFDTCDREVERFSGPAGCQAAKEIFCADSQAVVDILALRNTGVLASEPGVLAVLMLDDLLSALHLDERDRTEWCRENIARAIDVSAASTASARSHFALSSTTPRGLASQPGGDEVRRILAARRTALSEPARRLTDLARNGLTQPLDTVYRTLSHLARISSPPSPRTLPSTARAPSRPCVRIDRRLISS
jgi:thiopeptide-type bacteriocin biosynthesis protein